MVKCLHGLPKAHCAICNGLRRPIIQSTKRKAYRLPSNNNSLRGMVVPSDSPLLTELGIDLAQCVTAPPVKVGHVRCSFCRTDVFEKLATFGDGSMRKTRKIVNHITPDFDYDDIHFSERLVACPKCVGEIKPILTGGVFIDGKRVGGVLQSSGIRFPKFD